MYWIMNRHGHSTRMICLLLVLVLAKRQGGGSVARCWVYDSNLINEPNGSGLCRGHNPYLKPPVLLGLLNADDNFWARGRYVHTIWFSRFNKVAFQTFKAAWQSCGGEKDMMCIFDGGSQKGSMEVKKTINPIGGNHSSILLCLDQQGMIHRKDYFKKRQCLGSVLVGFDVT